MPAYWLPHPEGSRHASATPLPVFADRTQARDGPLPVSGQGQHRTRATTAPCAPGMSALHLVIDPDPVRREQASRRMAASLRLATPGRHLFLCSDQTVAKCCSKVCDVMFDVVWCGVM